MFELCAESLESCLLAKPAGVARIELCSDLAVEGLTPSHGLTRSAVEQSGVPVFELLRPRAGDFVYTDTEFQVMQEDLQHGRALGVSGFALGLLRPDGRVDVERTRVLVEMAGSLEVTFHRAFDATSSLREALEDVIAAGCRRVLTSGGAPDVMEGADALAALVEQAAGRIEIAAGGGLRTEHAADLVRRTRATHFHGSVRQTGEKTPALQRSGQTQSSAVQIARVDPRELRQMVECLQAGARPVAEMSAVRVPADA